MIYKNTILWQAVLQINWTSFHFPKRILFSFISTLSLGYSSKDHIAKTSTTYQLQPSRAIQSHMSHLVNSLNTPSSQVSWAWYCTSFICKSRPWTVPFDKLHQWHQRLFQNCATDLLERHTSSVAKYFPLVWFSKFNAEGHKWIF